MTPDDDLTPRLGWIRDIGQGGAKRFGKQVRRAARQLGSKRSSKHFTGRQAGLGGAKARQFTFQTQRLAASRQRRVIVKAHIARSGRSGGAGVFRAHVNYIQRDGVNRDGVGGELYSSEEARIDAGSFLDRSSEDRHQFRLIVSPEDGDKLSDLKAYTREFMSRVESDLGTRLDWVAVDHFNTGHPHTHIVIRGKDQRGKDLVIAPDYIKSGLRHRARELATERLGPRRDIEIARAKHSEINKDRFTGIDRAIQSDLEGNDLTLVRQPQVSSERFDRSLRLQRLRHLQALGLAREISKDRWRFTQRWEEMLRELGRRGDIVRSLAAKLGRQDGIERLQTYRPGSGSRENLIGEVVSNLPNDELKGTRALIVDDMSGRRWVVDIPGAEPGTIPSDQAIVEITQKTSQPGAADRVISDLSKQTGGVYSDDVHRQYDPRASLDYRRAHVRRLEALRRQGIVERAKNGVWHVPADFLERVTAFERENGGALSVRVRSWISLEKQISYPGLTWLDQPDSELQVPRYQDALKARHEWLRSEGWLDPNQDRLSPGAATKLAAADLNAVSARLANHSKRDVTQLGVGDQLNGRYEGAVNLGNKRMAIIGNAKEFALVPWRKEIERHRGREMTIHRRSSGVSWTLIRRRELGLSR